MKIALVTNLFGQYARGGAEELVKKIAEALERRGDNVFVISAQPYQGLKSLWARAQIDHRIKTYRFYPLNLFFYSEAARQSVFSRMIWHVLDTFNIWSYFQIKKIMLAEKPDLVLLHNLKGLGYLIPYLAKRLRLKTILTLHDVQLINPSGLILKGNEDNWLNICWPVKMYQGLCHWLFDSMEKVTAPSEFLLDLYKEKGFFKKAEMNVIAHPSIVAGFRAEPPKRKKSSPPVLLFAGQIEQHKGINWLLAFLKQESFSIQGQTVRLAVAGEGREREFLQAKFESAQWLGRIDHSQLLNKMRAADFLIFPSLCYENSPSVIGEAFSLGLPVIAANIGGVPELVKEKWNGFLFEAGETESLKQALGRAFNLTDQEYTQISQQAVQSVQHFTMEHYLDNLLKYVLKNSPSGRQADPF